MKWLKNLIIHEALDSITQPISDQINSNKHSYLLEKGIQKLGWRAIRRLLAFRISGQKKYLVYHVNAESWKRCLWLYYNTPQIGDALMDLAPRSLLQDLGIKVDLYTHQHLADLFTDDVWLNLVATDPSTININDYDFVITSSYKWRALKHKLFFARRLPWISIFGKFSGPELNRSLYATKRISETLNQKLNLIESAFHAYQKLSFKDCKQIEYFPNSVAISIGGVDSTRTYEKWHNVVSELQSIGIEHIILIGNENGIAYTDAITSLQKNTFKIHNYVGQTSLKECLQLMQRSSIIVASDGGLMHLAITCNKPVIGLFNQAIKPNWRLPESLLPLSIQSSTRYINDIPPNEIVKMIEASRI